MSLQFNHRIIDQHGGNCCGEDRFTIVSCAECQGQYLFNRALNDIYYDPENLSRRFFKIEGITPPCGYCGAVSWQFAEPGPNEAAVYSGPWAWVLSRSFTFSADHEDAIDEE